jgi:hypothetical protein
MWTWQGGQVGVLGCADIRGEADTLRRLPDYLRFVPERALALAVPAPAFIPTGEGEKDAEPCTLETSRRIMA